MCLEYLDNKISKKYLFDCSSEKPKRLVAHFQQTFNEFKCITLETHRPVLIGAQIYNKIHIIEDLESITRLLRAEWFSIQGSVLKGDSTITEIVSSREFINQAFDGIIQSLLLCDNPSRKEKFIEHILKNLELLSNATISIAKLQLQKHVSLKTAFSNTATCPIYQYLHTLLEVYYYIIVLHYICFSKVEIMEKHLEDIIGNLALISKASFENSNKSNKCTCIKFSWLTTQFISEKIDVTGNLFWKIFNKVLEKEAPLFALNLLTEISFVQCLNADFEEEGVKCDRIKANYDFLELKFKELLAQANSDTLMHGLKIIEPLVSNLWLKEGRIHIFQIIWDFYSKRLNVSNRNACNISAVRFIETLDTIVSCPKECKEDFEIYIGLLVHHLREYPMQWGKMKGRIYSQLGPNKVKDLSDVGLRHVMLLFLALSSINFEELEKKIIGFLENLPVEKKFTPLVWNMYGALILKYVLEGRSIEKISPSMLNMLQEASADQKCFHLIKEFLINLEHIINHSMNMQLNQWQLLGSWLGKYQMVCYFPDLNQSLGVILLLLNKCSDADSWSFWETCFKEYIYPNLRHLANTSTAPAIVGTIAGKLAILCTHLTTEAFAFFNNETVSPKISSKFLEVILENYPNSLIITPQQESIIVQSWVKICFLSTDSPCDLTRNVIKLDMFSPTLKALLKESTNPMESFLEYIGNHSKQLNMQQSDIVKLSELAFGNLDKTLTQYLLKPDKEDIVLNIYKYVALAFLNCGNLLYNRNKPVTPLTKLVQTLLLSMDFLMGKKTPHKFVLNSIKSTWHIFFEAFINMNSNNDSYLERTLKDMVVKYLPFFPTFDSPIVNALENPKFAEIILDKIYISFFKPPTKESDANTLKALKIVSDLANSTTSLTIYKLIINKNLYGLFEVVIFHPQRSTAIGVIKTITSSPLFTEVKQEFKNTVLAITEKNLGLNTVNYFQLMICLAKFVPDEITDLLVEIRVQVANAERRRGVGFDKSLRLQIEKLENALQSRD